MNDYLEDKRLIVKHVHQSKDKASMQINLNHRMGKVISRYLKKGNISSISSQ